MTPDLARGLMLALTAVVDVMTDAAVVPDERASAGGVADLQVRPLPSGLCLLSR